MTSESGVSPAWGLGPGAWAGGKAGQEQLIRRNLPPALPALATSEPWGRLLEKYQTVRQAGGQTHAHYSARTLAEMRRRARGNWRRNEGGFAPAA
jgi:hypothetical protein